MVLEPNRTVYHAQTWTAGGLPGPVANTNLDPEETVYQVKSLNYILSVSFDVTSITALEVASGKAKEI
jgi:hypothetical protein